MAYRRETLVMRTSSGNRIGFLIWERGPRQGSLRCNLDGLPSNAEMRLLWMAEDGFSLHEGGALRSDGSGAVRQTLLIAGEVALVGAVLAREDGGMLAHAFASSAQSQAPDRLVQLQAQMQTRSEAKPTTADIQDAEGTSLADTVLAGSAGTVHSTAVGSAHVSAKPVASGEESKALAWPDPLKPYQALFESMRLDAAVMDPQRRRAWQSDVMDGGALRGLELRCDAEGMPHSVAALWRAPAWPALYGVPDAVWHDGCWMLPLAEAIRTASSE